MLDNFSKKFKNKSWIKILGWIAFVLVMIACCFGIGFGVDHFVKKGTKNKGTKYTNSLQSVVEIQLDQNKSDDENLKVVKDIASKMTNQIRIMGANQIQVDSGLQKTTTASSSSSGKPTVYGAIYIYTEQNLPGYSIDFDELKPTNGSDISSQLGTVQNQKLALYYALANSYNYQLENPEIFNSVSKEPNENKDNSSADNDNSTNENITPYVNFKRNYNLNTNSKATKDDINIDFKLPSTPDNKNQWNLSNFQKQFTTAFSWDGKEERATVVSSKTDTSGLPEPNEQYILWTNRTGLINRLEVDATIGTLKGLNGAGLTSLEVTAVNKIYQSLSPADQNFAEWVGNSTISGGYQVVMQSLTAANKNDYGFVNNDKNNKEIDPLLGLLNQYYLSSTYNDSVNKSSSSSSNSSDSIKFTKNYEWLYSWNFKNLQLLNGYCQPIDYANFFNYFKNDTNLKSDDIKGIKSTYYSKTFTVPEVGKSDSQIVDLISNINHSSFTQPIINQALLEPFEQGVNNNNASKIYNGLEAFLDTVVSQYNSVSNKSVTTLDAFNGTLVGLSVLVLLIGIIVSLIYRVPGFLSFLTSALSFALSLTMFASLHMLFSIDTYLALFISIIAMYIPLLISQNEFRNAIKKKRLNLFNSFVYSLKSFLKSTITIYISMLIIALVFMFFGQYQIKGFGSMLVLTSFSCIISSGVIYFILYAMSYWLFASNKPNAFISNRYVKLVEEINLSTFNDANKLEESHSLLDRITGKLAIGFVKKQWWIWLLFSIILVLGIIGCIVLTTVGPGYSIAFKSSTEIVLTWKDSSNLTQQIETLKNLISNEYSIKWVTNTALTDGAHQIIGYASKPIDISSFYDWLSKQSTSKELINNISFRTTSDAMPLLLFHNAVNCMLISLGFLAIWSILALNFINFIPIFVVSCIVNIASFGFVGIIRVPVDTSSISCLVCIFTFSQLLIYGMYSSFKFQFNMKSRNDFKQMLDFTKESLKSIFLVYLGIFAFFFVSALIMMIFTSTGFVYNQIILFVNSLVVYLIIVIACPTSFALAMMLRELYLSKVITNKKLRIKHKEYDKIDEQEIYGINRH